MNQAPRSHLFRVPLPVGPVTGQPEDSSHLDVRDAQVGQPAVQAAEMDVAACRGQEAPQHPQPLVSRDHPPTPHWGQRAAGWCLMGSPRSGGGVGSRCFPEEPARLIPEPPPCSLPSRHPHPKQEEWGCLQDKLCISDLLSFHPQTLHWPSL